MGEAATIYWNGTDSNNATSGWNAVGSWSTVATATTPAPAAVPGASDLAVFSISPVTAAQTVDLNANQSSLGLVFLGTETGGVTIQNGTGTDTLIVGASGIVMNAGTGAVTVSSSLLFNSGSAAITGSGDTFTATGAGFNVSNPTATAVSLNMSGLSTFNYSNTAGVFTVGGAATAGTTNLTLAPSTNITAGTLLVGPNGLGGGPGVANLYFGQSTTINASTITMSQQKFEVTATFASGLTSPTLTIQGTGGAGTFAAMTLGQLNNTVYTAYPNSFSTTGGTLNAYLSSLLIGNVSASAASGRYSSDPSTFTVSAGLVEITGTLTLGQITGTAGTNQETASGTFNMGGATVYANTITLADAQSSETGTGSGATGIFLLNSGTLYAATIHSGGTASTVSRTFNFSSGTISNLTGDLTTTGLTAADLTISGPSATSQFVLTLAGTGTHNINASGGHSVIFSSSANLAGSGVLTFNGPGTLSLNGVDSFSGGTNLAGGTMVGNSSSSTNSFLEFGTGAITLSGGTLNLNAEGTGSNQLIITGNGTTGNAIAVATNSTINVDHVSTNTGGVFQFGALNLSTHALTLAGADGYGANFSGTMTVGAGATLNAAGAAVSIIGSTSGANLNITGTGSGSVTLAGTTDDSGFTATVLTGGTLYLGKTSATTVHAVGATGTSFGLTINTGGTAVLAGTGGDQIYNGGIGGGISDNGTFDLNGRSETINSLSGAGTITNSAVAAAGTLTYGTGTVSGSTGTFTGTVSDGGSTTALNVANGSLTLSGTNTYSGGTQISGGTLVAGSASALGTGNVTNSATLDLGGGAPVALSLGSGTYTQGAAGTLVLQVNGSSAGNYSSLSTAGAVSLNGTLKINTAGPAADGVKFQAIGAGGISGTFSAYTVTGLAANTAVDTSNIEKTGQLSVVNYFNGFENVNGTWANNASTFASSVTAYPLGASPITPGGAVQVVNSAMASSNSAYGQLTPTAMAISAGGPFPASANVGPLTRYNGNSSTFGTGFTTEADIYIDPAWTGDANGTGFDYSSAISDSSGNFLRDVILHVYNSAGTLYVSADNNSDYKADPAALTVDANHTAITTAGWYTVKDVFRDNGSGSLAVDVELFDHSGSMIYSQTLLTGDATSGVGGNNYSWFVNIDTGSGAGDYLNVDNIKLLNNTGSGTASPLTAGAMLLGPSPHVGGTLGIVDIAGTDLGGVTDGYNNLDIPDGIAVLSGELSVNLVDGFASEITSSDVFTILEADGISGGFDNVVDGERFDTADGTGSFLANYVTADGVTSLQLTDFQPAAVPEPASLGTLAAAGVMLLRRRRQSR